MGRAVLVEIRIAALRIVVVDERDRTVARQKRPRLLAHVLERGNAAGVARQERVADALEPKLGDVELGMAGVEKLEIVGGVHGFAAVVDDFEEVIRDFVGARLHLRKDRCQVRRRHVFGGVDPKSAHAELQELAQISCQFALHARAAGVEIGQAN